MTPNIEEFLNVQLILKWQDSNNSIDYAVDVMLNARNENSNFLVQLQQPSL